jgi:hypothetical protein
VVLDQDGGSAGCLRRNKERLLHRMAG